MSFICPKCQSYMFGSSSVNGKFTYHCHGNERWSCDFSCSEEYFNKHFSSFVQETVEIKRNATPNIKESIDILVEYYDDEMYPNRIVGEAWKNLKTFVLSRQATNNEDTPGLVHGTGMFIDLTCPSCKNKLVANVTLETHR